MTTTLHPADLHGLAVADMVGRFPDDFAPMVRGLAVAGLSLSQIDAAVRAHRADLAKAAAKATAARESDRHHQAVEAARRFGRAKYGRH